MAITVPGLTLSILRQETTAQRGRPLLMSGRFTAFGLGLPAYIRVYLEGPSYEPEVRSFDTFAAPFSGDYSVNVISEKDGRYDVYAQAFPPPLIPTGPPFPEPVLLPPAIAESTRPPLVVGLPVAGGVIGPDGQFLEAPPQTPIEFRPVITVAPGVTVTVPGVPAAYPGIPYPPPPPPPPRPAPLPGVPVEAAAAIVEDIRMVTPAIAPGQDAVGSITWRNTTATPRQYHLSFYLIDQAGARYGPLQVDQFVTAPPQIPNITATRTPTEGLPLGAYDALAEIYDAETNALLDSRSFPARLYIQEVVPPEVPVPPPPPLPPPPEVPTVPTGEMLGEPRVNLPYELTVGETWTGSISLPTLAPVPLFFNTRLILRDPRGFEAQVAEAGQTLQPGQILQIPVNFNSSGFTPGTYTILLRVFDEFGTPIWEFPLGFLSMLEALLPPPPVPPELPELPTPEMVGLPVLNAPRQVTRGDIWSGSVSVPTFGSAPYYFNARMILEDPQGRETQLADLTPLVQPGQNIEIPFGLNTYTWPEADYAIILRVLDQFGTQLAEFPMGFLSVLEGVLPPLPEIPTAPTADMFGTPSINLPSQVEIGEVWQGNISIPTYVPPALMQLPSLPSLPADIGLQLESPTGQMFNVGTYRPTFTPGETINLPVNLDTSVLSEEGIHNLLMNIQDLQGNTLFSNIIGALRAMLPAVPLPPLPELPSKFSAVAVQMGTQQVEVGESITVPFTYTHVGGPEIVTLRAAIGDDRPAYLGGFDEVWWADKTVSVPVHAVPTPLSESITIQIAPKFEAAGIYSVYAKVDGAIPKAISPVLTNIIEVIEPAVPPAPPPPADSEITGLTVLLEPATYLPGDTISVGVWVDHQGAAESVELYAAVGIAGAWFNEVYIGRQVADLPRDDMPTGHIFYVPIQVPERPRPDTYSVYAKTVLRAPEISSDIMQNVVEIREAAEQFTLSVGQEPVVGTVQIDPEKPAYDRLDVVRLTAVIDPFVQEQYAFDYWLINGSRRDYNPSSVIMMRDSEAIVYWKQIAPPAPEPPPPEPPPVEQYNLVTSASPRGYISKSPDKPSYDYNEPVTLEAMDVPGPALERWTWDSWEVNGLPPPRQVNPLRLYMAQDINVVAYYRQEG